MNKKIITDYTDINKVKKFANKEIIEEIAEELNIPESKVKEIVESQFDYYARIVRMGNFEQLIIPYLGKLKPNIKKVIKLSKPKEA